MGYLNDLFWIAVVLVGGTVGITCIITEPKWSFVAAATFGTSFVGHEIAGIVGTAAGLVAGSLGAGLIVLVVGGVRGAWREREWLRSRPARPAPLPHFGPKD